MKRFRLYKRADRRDWHFYFYDETGRRRFRKTAHRARWRAEEEARDFVKEYFDGLGTREEITFTEYTKDFFVWDKCTWIKRQHATGKSFSRVMARHRRGHLRNYILPVFGERNLADLKAHEIQAWLVSLPLSNQTKNHILYTLNIVLRQAEFEELIDRNPVDKVSAMAKNYRARDTLTNEELENLFPENPCLFHVAWPNQKIGTIFCLMASTGMRTGEIQALQWSAILWDIPGVLIVRAVKADRSIGEPKAKEKRGILLPERTVDVLRRWHDLIKPAGVNELVFPNEQGGILWAHLPEHFKAGLQRAGISTEGRNLVPHSLRHTYNTRMRELVTDQALREFTGHRSQAMTDRYDNPQLVSRLRSMSGIRDSVNRFWG